MDRPETTQEFALAKLRQAILARELRPGTPLRQATLASNWGISRVPLREALKMLEGEGLVTHEPHYGYRVAKLSIQELLEVYRVRQLVETEVARMAVERMTPELVDVIRRLAKEVDAAGDAGDLVAMASANREFHFALFNAAGTTRMVKIIANLWDATDSYRGIYYSEASSRQRVSDDHTRIVEALSARDADLLVEQLDLHRQHAVDALAQIIAD